MEGCDGGLHERCILPHARWRRRGGKLVVREAGGGGGGRERDVLCDDAQMMIDVITGIDDHFHDDMGSIEV